MTTREMLLELAARLDQTARELEAVGEKAQDVSFAASHRLGVIAGGIRFEARRLQAEAAKLAVTQGG